MRHALLILTSSGSFWLQVGGRGERDKWVVGNCSVMEGPRGFLHIDAGYICRSAAMVAYVADYARWDIIH